MDLVTRLIVLGCLGAFFGFTLLVAMALFARRQPQDHDEIRFTSPVDVLEKAQIWATLNGYRLAEDAGTAWTWQKGRNLLTAPMFLQLLRDGDDYVARSFVEVNALIVKGRMPLTGGGLVAKVPRALARKAQNHFYASIGQRLLPD